MAKIILNNTEYSIDDATLAPATAELKSHLSTVMNGEGAVITIDGTSYNVDATKLAAAKDDFIAHLGTIAGNGAKIKIGDTEYSIDSAKLAGAISELESVLSGTGEEHLEGTGSEYYTLAPTALSFRSTEPLAEFQEVQVNEQTVDPANYTLEEGSTIVKLSIDYLKTLDIGSHEVAIVSQNKTVKGEFSVAAPEFNNYGFYYNQPYSANLPMFGGDTAFFIREDGTFDIITVGKNPTTSTYTVNGNTIAAVVPPLGAVTCTVSADGTSIYCNEVGVTFELFGSTAIAADDDYVYIYKEDLGGYEVNAIDKTKAEYGDIKTGINGIDTVKLMDYMFAENHSLISIPHIPDSVTTIGEYAFSSCESLTSVEIPDSVTTIGHGEFNNCDGLTNIDIPNSVTVIKAVAFNHCDNLTNLIIGYGVTTIGVNAFSNCSSLTNISFRGTVEQWNCITKEIYWNSLVPATHIQCSDGTVAL